MCRQFLGNNMGVFSCIQTTLSGEVLLDIEVQPNSSRQGVIGLNEWRNKIQVAVKAEAQKGRANFAVCNVLKTLLSTEVEIVQGLNSRQKKVKVRGLDSPTVVKILEGLIES